MSQHAATQTGTDTDRQFRATIDGDALGGVLDAIDALVGECVLHAGPDGVAVDAQDPATVALVSVDLPVSAFDTYRAEGTPLGVDLERLRDVVGMADDDHPVAMAYDAETRTLDLRVDELAYTLGLVDPDAIRSAPDVDYEDHLAATVALPGSRFAHAVRACDMVADHCALGVDPDAGHLYATAEGDVDSVRIEHRADDCDTFRPGDAHSLFSTPYLSEMARVVPDDATARLRLGEEAPLELSFALGDADVTYFLAPRRTTT